MPNGSKLWYVAGADVQKAHALEPIGAWNSERDIDDRLILMLLRFPPNAPEAQEYMGGGGKHRVPTGIGKYRAIYRHRAVGGTPYTGLCAPALTST